MGKAKRQWRRITEDKRREMMRLAARGMSRYDIAS